MPKPKPIPVNCFDNVASAFLVTNGHTVWMVTCAHIVTGEPKSVGTDPRFGTAVIRVIEPALHLPLAVGGKSRARSVNDKTNTYLVDAMSIKLSAEEAEALKSYGMFKLNEIVEAKVSDKVTVAGFPDLHTGVTHVKKLKAKIDRIDGISIVLSEPSEEGYSGGPVYNNNGLIGIAYGDEGKKPIFINGLVYSLEGLRENLFK